MQPFTILHTNDTHGRVEGLARIATGKIGIIRAIVGPPSIRNSFLLARVWYTGSHDTYLLEECP